MDLSDWTVQEAAKVGSLNKLSKAIGLSRQTILDWRDRKASFLTDKGANAIAAYLGLKKTPEQIRQMFDMPAHPYLEVDKKSNNNSKDAQSDSDRLAKLEKDYELLKEDRKRLTKLEKDYGLLKEDRELLETEVNNLKEYIDFLVAESAVLGSPHERLSKTAELHEGKRAKESKTKI
jgi:predicted nuclease with TOPRIM domain